MQYAALLGNSWSLAPTRIRKKRKRKSSANQTEWVGLVDDFDEEYCIKIPKKQKIQKRLLPLLAEEISRWKAHPHKHTILCRGACLQDGNIKLVVEDSSGNLSLLLQKELSLFHRLDIAQQICLGILWFQQSIGINLLRSPLSAKNIFYNPQGNQGKSYIVKVGNVNLWNNALLTPTELQAQNLRDFGSILILILRSGNSADEEKFKAMTEQNQKKYIDNCIACKTYPDLGDIVKECLYGEHIEADCYTKIRQRLQAIMIQDAIGDEEGIEFWSKYFAEQTSLSISVPITRFVETLFEWVAIPANVEAVVYWEEELSKIGNIRDRLSSISLGGDYSDSTSTSSDGEYLSSNDSGDEEEAKHPYERPPEEHILYFRLLKQVFGERASTGTRTSNHSSLQVSVLNFGRILKWYGPLNSTKYKAKIENKLSDLLMNVVERIEKTLRYDFFHGNIDGIVAQERLQKFDGDTYLIRLSSQPGFFVLSRNRVSSKSQQRVFDEGRISYVHGMGFSLDSTEYHTSLGKFVARYKKPLRLKVKCKGSQNTPLFSPRRNPYAALF